MSAAAPVPLANLTAPPAPGQCDPGGGALFSYQGQPYWLDGQGRLQALTSAGASAVTWAGPAWGMTLLAATPVAGYALVNGTGSIISWTAPNDGNLHRIAVFSSLVVGTTETGGQVNLAFTDPSAAPRTLLFLAGAQTAGYHASTGGGVPMLTVVAPGSVCTVAQGSALTGGSATLWAEIWGS